MAKRDRLTNVRYTQSKTAGDPFTLNAPERKEVDHTAEEYAIRSDFAEGVNSEHPWKNEKRDPDTGLPVVSAAQIKAMKRHAAMAMKLAEVLLPGADEDTADEQAFELMKIPQSILSSTYARVARYKKADGEMGGMGGPAPAEEQAPPLEESGAQDLHSGDDLSGVDAPEKETPTVEDALSEAKNALETVEQVLEDISFDDGGETEEPAADPVLAALFEKKLNKDQILAAQKRMAEKQANKQGIKAVPGTTTKTASKENLLSKLWRRDPDVRDIFQ